MFLFVCVSLNALKLVTVVIIEQMEAFASSKKTLAFCFCSV